MNHLFTIAIFLFTSCLALGQTYADPIYIDFNKDSEAPYQDTSSVWWNALDDTPGGQEPQALIDAANNPTNATIYQPLRLDGKTVTNPYNGTETWLINNPTAVARGSITPTDTTSTYTIAGLPTPPSGKSYAIDIYAAWHNADGETIIINGGDAQWIDVNDNHAANPQAVLKWTGLNLDASNNITVTLIPDTGVRAFINAMKIELVDGTATVDATIVSRFAAYNNSAFDNNNPAPNTDDDNAIATDKQPLMGTGTASFNNYTSYCHGINTIIIDIANTQDAAAITAADFELRVGNDNNLELWSPAPNPTSVTVREGEGAGGSDRITLTFADNAITKQWLEVKVLANDNTGLSTDDVFYYGNAIGDTGNSTTDAIVDTSDEIIARNSPRNFMRPATIDILADFNRDEKVNATDEIIARNNTTTFASALKLISIVGPNTAPIVTATVDTNTITLPIDTVNLSATVTDDGQPNPPATVTYLWEMLTGPAPVTFGDEYTKDTTATFTTDGVYILQLTADDDELTTSDTVTVTVEPAPIDYYVAQLDPNASDTNPGTEALPFLTVDHAVNIVTPGDTIYIKEGIYREYIKLDTSGTADKRITMTNYQDDRAVISGADEITGWIQCSQAIALGNPNYANMYYTDINWRPTSLYADEIPLTKGRMPLDGWWYPTTGSTTTIVDPTNLTQPDDYWNNAEVFVWNVSQSQQSIQLVTDYDLASQTLTTSAFKFSIEADDRYYIMNRAFLISGENQWAVEDNGDGTYRLFVYLPNGDNPANYLMEAPSTRTRFIIELHKQGYWMIDGLEIRHAPQTQHAIGGYSSPAVGHNIIQNCSIHHNGASGVYETVASNTTYRRNYIAYNGGISGTGVIIGNETSNITIEENEIANNGKDGLKISGTDNIVRNNYIHGHWFWQHADNNQDAGAGQIDLLYESNYVRNGGQNFMTEDTSGLTIRNCVFIGSRGYQIIVGRGQNFTLDHTTMLFSGNGMVNTSNSTGFNLHNNILVMGTKYAAWGADPSINYTSDYNLFHFGDGIADDDWRVVVWNGNWLSRGLAQYVAESGHDTHSVQGDPQFVNAPVRYHRVDISRPDDHSPTRLYMTGEYLDNLNVGDNFELDWDGVVRQVTAKGADYIDFTPAEPRVRLKATVIANWKTNTNFNLDLSLQPGSIAENAAADGTNMGSTINTLQYSIGDFTGDGVRDIPTWPVTP